MILLRFNITMSYYVSIFHWTNPLGLFWWYWLGTWEYAPPRDLRFNPLQCQFKWTNLPSSKKYSIELYQRIPL